MMSYFCRAQITTSGRCWYIADFIGSFQLGYCRRIGLYCQRTNEWRKIATETVQCII